LHDNDIVEPTGGVEQEEEPEKPGKAMEEILPDE